MVESKKSAKQPAKPIQAPPPAQKAKAAVSKPAPQSTVGSNPAPQSTVGSNPIHQPQVVHKQKSKTKIVAHFDCGFPNNLFIRGEGVSALSWDKGLPMKNVAPNEWVWESDRPFSTAHFKILINDHQFEIGENHTLAFGQEIDFSPLF